MPSATDWPQRPIGFNRDPANEQKLPLGPGQVFTGGWTRIQDIESFLLLYGTNAPFTMQIQWSADGVVQDTDPFATITPQVRFALGLYSVISPQSTFFRPFYRIRITNGPSPQYFVVSDALLLSTVFPGYDISVDGPIPVLGLAKLTHGLGWGKGPTGWAPQKLTAAGNQQVALVENLLPGGTLPVSLDPASLAALETITAGLDAATLAALETISAIVSGTVALDPATIAALATGAAPPNLRFYNATSTIQQVKVGPGTLQSVVLSDGPAVLSFYDAIAGTTGKFLQVTTIKDRSESLTNLAVPFTLGLRVQSTAALPYTLAYR